MANKEYQPTIPGTDTPGYIQDPIPGMPDVGGVIAPRIESFQKPTKDEIFQILDEAHDRMYRNEISGETFDALVDDLLDSESVAA